MTPKLKKIIAKEGLIFLGFAVIISLILTHSFDWITDMLYSKREKVFFQDVFDLKGRLDLYAVFSYPVYVIIRFIIWAIRTLKER